MTDMQRYGARGPLSNPPQWGEYEVVLAWEADAAIAAARADMLAKCIALIEESVPWSSENWMAVDERAAILTALRALEEKP